MIEEKVINTIRKLALDEIAEAKSGHPGIALGIAPMLFAVFSEAKIQPQNPNWFNRDRIILSCGHGSSVLYSTLHLFGYDVGLEDLKEFRKLGSKTPGHPEYDVTCGVDASTGALGQGFATGVGMALAESHIAKIYNKPNISICDHNTYIICSDGDLMEGISYEASNLAGKFKLNKLIVLYDSNNVTMTDELNITSDEDVKMRFEACGFNVIKVKNGENYKQISSAIKLAKKSKTKPTLIICNTTIGYGSKLENSPKCHGKPFNFEEVKEICKNFGVSEIPFEIDEDVLEYCKDLKNKNIEKFKKYEALEKEYKQKYPKEYKELFGDLSNEMIKTLEKQKFISDISTREASGILLNTLANKFNNIFGGGADVAKSTMAYIESGKDYSSEIREAKNIPYGIREHAMGAMANGIALHKGLQTFASTFLIFSDYLKYAIRQSALMNLPVWYVFSHDSIYIGEDGPSHQPIEQTQSLRLVPNLMVVRPADGVETIGAYKLAIKTKSPTAFILSRQKLPQNANSDFDKVAFGGYVISKEEKKLDAILLASGSEVSLCLEAKKQLKSQNIDVRVVSIPCFEMFLKQDKKYINSVLPKKCSNRVAVDVGVRDGWFKFVGENGKILGIDVFGESGNGQEVANLFGINAEEIASTVKKMIK
ncbi:MAG: transketolase [Clostridia bacterium]|nr:transketolase [Clostridia bacterium]